MRSRDSSPITDGTAQDDRFPAPLADHYFDVDERPYEDLIARTAQFAKFVRYYSAVDPNIKNWKPLFATDEIVILADIMTTDSVRMEAEYREKTALSPEKTAEYLIRFALRIDGWFQRLKDAKNESGRLMSRAISELIQRKLKSAIETVARLFPPHAPGPESESYDAGIFRAFHSTWGFARHAAPAPRQALPDAATPPEREKALLETFYSLVSAVSFLKPLALERLSVSAKSGDHNPAIALFLSFARLLGKARDKANLFTSRHRDFYYGDVLRITPRSQRLDHTFLAFETDPGLKQLLIPKGARFTAGKQGGAGELIYESDYDLAASDVRIADVRTLYCARDPQISPEYELQFADALRALTIVSGLEPAPADIVCWPIFGSEGRGNFAVRGENASAGFAIASSALRLREGDREVTVNVVLEDAANEGNPTLGRLFRSVVLGCADASPAEIAEFHRSALAALGLSQDADKVKLDQELLPQDPKYIFDVVVGSAFSISLTTATGWYHVPGYGVEAVATGKPDRYSISFSFVLGPEAPSLAPADAAIHGRDYSTGLPMIRFLLASGAHIYSLSLFSELNVLEVQIDSHVSGATRLVAWNQFGQLDPSRPFNPFGPLPTTNSYFIFGNYDAAGMNLTCFDINIEWGELPDSPEGFEQYYREYDTRYSNEAFLAALSILSDGRWRPEVDEPGAVVRLFDGKKNLRVDRDRTIRFDLLRSFRHIEPGLPEDQFRYDQRARGGFFRIDLVAPETGFGHAEYSTVLTRTLSENARPSGWRRNELKPLPSPPYTPVINRISLDFTASSSIRVGDVRRHGHWTEKICLIHPFGVETVETSRPWPMLPPCEYNGNLFIGLAGTEASGMLSLLFHLREDSATSITSIPEPVYWSYLASNQWKPVAETRLLSDSTQSFLTSGIVTIDLPEDCSCDNTVMPKDLYWLRVSANKNFASFCSLYSIRTNAVPVTRMVTPDASFVLPEPLPARSIKASANTIPGLRSVTQPVPSVGGRAEETPRQQIARAAERLRHKARASTPYDYERLVLEAFPEVVKVKCFPAMTSESERLPAPGHVMVVVVPRQPAHFSDLVFDPMLDAITLKHIRDYLQSCASRHVSIEVRNPVYEEVIVRCVVALKRERMRDRGYWLNQLNQALVDYLSPWTLTGPKPRFGWSVEGNEVQAFIRGLDYIDFVTQFSMLHMTSHADRADERRYRLRDTADTPDDSAVIRPRYPWSLAIPNSRHILETIENKQGLRPESTGLGRLEIGNTFTVRT